MGANRRSLFKFPETFLAKQSALERTLAAMPDPPRMIDVTTPIREALRRGKARHADYTLHEPLDGVHLYDGGAVRVAWEVFRALGARPPL